MKRNKFFSRFIVVTLTAALLLITGSRAISVSALAVGPLADPVYDTEIIAFKEYVEMNLDEPQLDIMFFLIGGLAVAQMGAQDALLISPYPNEENVKEWIINCGIQLYNTVIGLVPSGDYYVGIPSIGSPATKGIPRQIIKALVAEMMGDAVVAINYPDLDTFLEENPDELYINLNKDLQIGVNGVFGLNGGLGNWQNHDGNWFNYSYSWRPPQVTGTALTEYNNAVSLLNNPCPVYLSGSTSEISYVNGFVIDFPSNQRFDFFINTANHRVGFVNPNGSFDPLYNNLNGVYVFNLISSIDNVSGIQLVAWSQTYNPNNFTSYKQIATSFLNNYNTWFTGRAYGASSYTNLWASIFPVDFFSGNVYVGASWETRELIENVETLNLIVDQINYYQQFQNDYLLDIRGLIEDLVDATDIINQIKNNLYDLTGIIELNPKFINVSIDLPDLSLLVDPPVPVNMNDIAELTDNTYLERVKEHARNAGDIFANYVAFWHNCDSDLVYTMFGAAILVLVGAFIGKWGHS